MLLNCRAVAHSYSSLNADGIGEIRVDAVKQVMIKGDLLKKEEEKLREMEVKVNKGTCEMRAGHDDIVNGFNIHVYRD